MSHLCLKLQKAFKFQIGKLKINRHLSLQENIAHKLLNDNGIKTPRFGVAKSDKQAEKIARDLLTKNLAIKAQVLSGGRGLGTFKNGFRGGVHAAISPEEVCEFAGKMIGQTLVTKQSGPEGKLCNSVLVTERKFPRREFYFAIALEREYNGPVVIASRQGGVNIEEVAKHSPADIIYEPIDMCNGMTREMASWIARRVGICDQPEDTIKMLCNLYKFFVQKDVLLAEINPWVEDVCMNYYALDVKLNFDPSGKFRQWEIFGMSDETQEDPKELAAKKLEASYISLDGSIGCMVNGSGLAMATNDIIKFHGGNPANFLDTGSMANAEAVKKSVGIILQDPKVRTILVNIYGGIMRCDIIVEGLLKAIKEFDIKIPIVVRLQGNKYKEGREMVRKANTNIITCETFSEAAEMAVRCAKIMELADQGNLEAALKMKLSCDCEPAKPATPIISPRPSLSTPSSNQKIKSPHSTKIVTKIPSSPQKPVFRDLYPDSGDKKETSSTKPTGTSSKSPQKPLDTPKSPPTILNPSTNLKPSQKISGPQTPSTTVKNPPTTSTSTAKPSSNPPKTPSTGKKSFSTIPPPTTNEKSQQDPKEPDNKDPFSNGDTVIIKT